MLKPFDTETGKPKKASDYTEEEKNDYRSRVALDEAQKKARAAKK